MCIKAVYCFEISCRAPYVDQSNLRPRMMSHRRADMETKHRRSLWIVDDLG